MKRLFFGLCLVAWMATLPTACKKDGMGSPSNPPLLTKVSQNGITILELFYDIDQKITRVNYYYQGEMSTYTLYEYDGKGLKESRRYDAETHDLGYQTVFTLDNFGRIVKGENYSPSTDFEEIASTHELAYNTDGRVTNRRFRTNTNVLYQIDFTYDAAGQLTGYQQTNLPGQPSERLSYRYEYTPSNRQMPAQWVDYVTLLELNGLESYLRELFMASLHYTSWNADGKVNSELEYQLSGHQFDQQGNVIRQIITRNNLLNPELIGTPNEMTYEYISP